MSKLNIKVALTYSEVYCDNCCTSIYKDGEFDKEKADVIHKLGKDDCSEVCEFCGCDDEWCVMMQWKVK
jgi:hypothetical protein